MAVFVGRQAVLAALDAALRTVTEPPEGVPRLPVAVLISGSAGMGKSTVLSRWTGTVGSRVAWGTCWQAEQAPAFWGWSQVLRALPEPPECSLLATVPAVAAVVPEWAPRETALRATGSGRVGERLLVFEAVAAVLAAATRSGARWWSCSTTCSGRTDRRSTCGTT
ncbi:MAG TPA: AAA family ATPase [Nakamurella sp.]